MSTTRQGRPGKTATGVRPQHSAVPLDGPLLVSANQLSQTTRNFRFLAEVLPEIIWTGEPDGTIDYMNARWFEYTGLTHEETYNETKSAVHPDEREEYHRRWANAVKTQQPYEMEYRFRRASDGMYRWHLGRGLPVRDETGNVIKWFGMCIDIHDQKAAEAEVRVLNEGLERKVEERTRDLQREIHERRSMEEENRSQLELLRIMIETMPMAAVATDWRHSVLHANENFCALFAPDLSKQEVLKRDFLQLLSDASVRFENAPDYGRFLHELREHPLTPLKREFVAREGRTYSFEYLPIAEGHFRRGHLLLCRDITQEKRIDRAKTEFMSFASHQLRTPLTSIRWALNRLTRKIDPLVDDGDRRLLRQAKSAVAGMADTITTMLAISRIEAGMLSLRESSVALKAFLESVVQEYAEQAARKNQTLTLLSDDITFSTDPTLLQEVVENLVSNAIKYTPEGGKVRIEAQEDAGHVNISVSDSGYGIPKSQQRRVFSKFFRADNVVRVVTEGTGLGLYLVSQLVKLLGAKIDFVSEQDKGTTFTVTVPLKA